ncbi:STAS domain-containing protein [Streptomyces sp. IBSBF 2435]|uniref:STAS domain-containing protein n=1 Tax=Streptomyces sp. IBSBF 2435 TaxID=2903531 RepID=UPI002FDC1C79
MSGALRVHIVEERGRLAVVAAVGDLDMSTAGDFHNAATGLIAEHPDLVVDLAGVEFCDSSGFNALLRVQRRVHEAGGRFALAAAPEPVARLLTLAGGGDDLFALYRGWEQGAEALSR